MKWILIGVLIAGALFLYKVSVAIQKSVFDEDE